MHKSSTSHQGTSPKSRAARLSLMLATAILLAGTADAQYIVTGKLISSKDKQALPYANVTMLRAADSTFLRGVISDDKGIFNIDNDTVPTLLRLSAMGYETQFVAVPATRNGGPTGLWKIDMGTIAMDEGATLLNTVSITETRPLYSVDGEKDMYNVAEDASIQTGNASDALQNAPGIEVDVEGNVTLNGKSVTVWINDRPSHLEGEALKQYIKMLPANSIDRIEVMKNPSAKYGGGEPVVNIVTNQRMLKNSFVSFGANGSSRPSISPWASYVYSNEKFNISAYISFNGGKYPSNNTSSGQLFNEDSLLSRTYSSHSHSDSRHRNIWANINASYEFDSMNRISGWFGTYPSWSDYDASSEMDRTEYIDNPGDYSNHGTTSTHSNHYGGFGGIDYTHKFNNDGHELSIDYNGHFYGDASNSSSSLIYPRQPQMSFSDNSLSRHFNGSSSLGIDYSLPYSKQGEIEMGVSLDLSHGLTNNSRDTLDNTLGTYRRDLLRSDTSHTPGNGISTYLTWRRQWGNFTLKLGGRLSSSFSTERHQSNTQYDTAVANWTFSPSIHASYRTESMHNISLSYRINTIKPNAGSLCRYPYFGIESFTTGNPLLQPQYEHNATLSWSKYFTKFGSVSVDASYQANINEYNTITDARYVQYFGRVVNYSMPYNNADGRRFDLTASCMYRPSAYLNLRLNIGLTDDWYSILPRQGQPPIEDEMLSFSIRGKLWTKLWKKVELFVSGRYSTPSHSWSKLEIEHARKSIDLGMSADFFDRKLSLYLNASDIFNWNAWSSTTINPYNSSTSTSKYTSRYITFGAALRFGKMELESQAKTGATESSLN